MGRTVSHPEKPPLRNSGLSTVRHPEARSTLRPPRQRKIQYPKRKLKLLYVRSSYRLAEPSVAGKKAEDFPVTIHGKQARLSDFRGKLAPLQRNSAGWKRAVRNNHVKSALQRRAGYIVPLQRKGGSLLDEGFEEAIDVGQVVEDGGRNADVAVGNANVYLSVGQALANHFGIADDEAANRGG